MEFSAPQIAALAVNGAYYVAFVTLVLFKAAKMFMMLAEALLFFSGIFVIVISFQEETSTSNTYLKVAIILMIVSIDMLLPLMDLLREITGKEFFVALVLIVLVALAATGLYLYVIIVTIINLVQQWPELLPQDKVHQCIVLGVAGTNCALTFGAAVSLLVYIKAVKEKRSAKGYGYFTYHAQYNHKPYLYCGAPFNKRSLDLYWAFFIGFVILAYVGALVAVWYLTKNGEILICDGNDPSCVEEILSQIPEVIVVILSAFIAFLSLVTTYSVYVVCLDERYVREDQLDILHVISSGATSPNVRSQTLSPKVSRPLSPKVSQQLSPKLSVDVNNKTSAGLFGVARLVSWNSQDSDISPAQERASETEFSPPSQTVSAPLPKGFTVPELRDVKSAPNACARDQVLESSPQRQGNSQTLNSIPQIANIEPRDRQPKSPPASTSKGKSQPLSFVSFASPTSLGSPASPDLAATPISQPARSPTVSITHRNSMPAKIQTPSPPLSTSAPCRPSLPPVPPLNYRNSTPVNFVPPLSGLTQGQTLHPVQKFSSRSSRATVSPKEVESLRKHQSTALREHRTQSPKHVRLPVVDQTQSPRNQGVVKVVDDSDQSITIKAIRHLSF